MAGHAPYLMPDGRSLKQYLLQEDAREKLRARRHFERGRDNDLLTLLKMRQHGQHGDEDLAELHALERAGAWFVSEAQATWALKCFRPRFSVQRPRQPPPTSCMTPS
jgi:hypothetical protein